MTDDEEEVLAPLADSDTTCPICFAEFLEPEDLKLHANQVHAIKGTCSCHFCVHIFASLDDYARHIIETHILSLSCCRYCTKVFQDENFLNNHEKKHCKKGETGVYNCSQCYNVFQNVNDLRKHEFESHNNNEDGVFLDDCFPHLSSYLNFKALTFLQSRGKTTVYICSYCDFKTSSPTKYINHLLKTQCRSLSCDKCCSVYNKRKKLQRHLSNSRVCSKLASKEEKVKTCPKCYESVDSFAYSQHLKSCNPLKCNHCNIILETMYELTEHQSKEHPMAILMKRCDFCRKEYVGNIRLEKHIEKAHKKELHLYKYECVYCEKLYFKHPQDMFRHFFSKHTQLKPYCCKICNLTFRVRKSFTIHIKLVHKSAGFVEFDERYHVFFSDTKSENPFQPKSLFVDEIQVYNDKKSTTNRTEESDDLNDTQTEAQTDAEDAPRKNYSQRKPPKLRYKEQKKSKESNAKCLNLQSDMSDEYQTEYLIPRKSLRKRTKANREENPSEEKIDSDVSEDEPLSKLKKQDNTKNLNSWKLKKSNVRGKKQRFICKICGRNCFTFQNYNHHITLHSKDEVKKCIKCFETFTSKNKLLQHISEMHSTSKLTETLKSLLERRKLGIKGTTLLTTPEKFRKTIKRVKCDGEPATVSIKEVNDMSVQKFIENFTPEENASSKTKKSIEINTVVSVKPVDKHISKPPMIKMTKFTPKPIPSTIKLAMPVRFKQVYTEKHKVNVKLVQQQVIEEKNDEFTDYGNDEPMEYDDDDQDKVGAVPDVAEEVMLEEEQEPKQPQYKIILPKLPAEYSKKGISIAHLLPEAPYYKIVKMKEVINQSDDKTEIHISTKPPTKTADADKPKSTKITLPSGTKLVNVNPLAHLIGDKPVDQIVGQRRSYYKPKTENFQEAIAKALSKLEDSANKKRTAKKAKKDLDMASIQVEQ